MSHVGKPYPFAIRRDWFVEMNSTPWGFPKNFRLKGATSVNGPAAGPWGTGNVSNAAIANDAAGEVEWWWDPPVGADPLSAMVMTMRIEPSLAPPFFHVNRWGHQVVYNGVRSVRWDCAWTVGGSPLRWTWNGGSPQLTVSPGFFLRLTNFGGESLVWADY